MRNIIAFVMLFVLVAQVATAQKKNNPKQGEASSAATPPRYERSDYDVTLDSRMAKSGEANLRGLQYYTAGIIKVTINDDSVRVEVVDGNARELSSLGVIAANTQGVYKYTTKQGEKITRWIAFKTDKTAPDSDPNAPDTLIIPFTPQQMSDGNTFVAEYIGDDMATIAASGNIGDASVKGATGANAVPTKGGGSRQHPRYVIEGISFEITTGSGLIGLGVMKETADGSLKAVNTPVGKVAPSSSGGKPGTIQKFSETK